MEKELAKRLAEKAAKGELSGEMLKDPLDAPAWQGNGVGSPGSGDRDVEAAPDSGVRHSSPGTPVVVTEEQDPHRPLTYSVYTVSELEAVRHQRMSMVGIPVVATPSNWIDVRKSLLVLLRAFWGGWVKAAKPRPALRSVCQVPSIAFLADLRVALSQLPWKKIGWIATVAGGAVALLLFTVITVAELTDDLKPTRPESSASATTQAAKIDPPPPAPAPTTEAAPEDPAIELDDNAAAAAAPAAAAPKPAAKPKPSAPSGKLKPKASMSGTLIKPTGPQFNP